MFEARDVMTADIVTIHASATVEQAIRVLVNARISGMPVVDDGGNLVGIISEFQLLEVTYDPTLKASAISQLMTRDVLTVSPATLLTSVANLLVVHRIRRVPVVEDGRVVGIIARSDILKYMVQSGRAIDDFFSELRCVGAMPCTV